VQPKLKVLLRLSLLGLEHSQAIPTFLKTGLLKFHVKCPLDFDAPNLQSRLDLSVPPEHYAARLLDLQGYLLLAATSFASFLIADKL
jgi:hypothetical protein